ncbi:MAG: helix-turn-helix domain-containing protein [Clostridia bacterium]|nr:helix-turn-helix domain-containing protein [Clostridia bacterium]MDE6758123.1 helix-turn-helix domain-containing protein [Clostridia bacterium]
MQPFINVKLIEDYIKANNLTVTKFCRLCKISPNSLKKLKNGEDCRVNIVFKIARVLDVKVSQMFK